MTPGFALAIAVGALLLAIAWAPWAPEERDVPTPPSFWVLLYWFVAAVLFIVFLVVLLNVLDRHQLLYLAPWAAGGR